MSGADLYYTAFFLYSVLRRMLGYAAVVYGFDALGGGQWSGLFYLCLVLPYLLSLPAGGVIDGTSKRTMLYATSAISAALLFVLTAAEHWRWLGGGAAHGTLIAAIIFAFGVAAAFSYPTFIAAIPDLTTPAKVGHVTVVINALGMVSVGCAPLAIGALRSHLRWPALFGALAALSLIAAFALLLVQLPHRPASGLIEPRRQRTRELWTYCREHPTLAGLFAALALFSVLGLGPLEVLAPLFAEKSLALSPMHAGVFIAVGGTGLVVGALGALKFADRTRLGLTLCGLAVSGALLMVVVTLVPLGAATFLFLVSGVFGGMFTSLSMASAQAIAPDALRGRVMGLFTAIVGAAPALGGVLAGAMAGAFGTVAAIRIIFAAAAVTFVLLYATLRSLRQP